MHVMLGGIAEKFLGGDDAVHKILNQISAVFRSFSKRQFLNLTIYGLIAFRSLIKLGLTNSSASYLEKTEESARGISRISRNWHYDR